MSRLALAVAFGLLAVLLAITSHAEPSSPRPLSVHIESPHAGIVEGPIVTLVATLSDSTIQRAVLISNGMAYDVPVQGGRVQQQLVAIPGNNRVGLVVRRGDETARDSITFRYAGVAMELVTLLTWPTEGEIIDLWVREPNGETCKWDHRRTESGGHLLDFSDDAIGFGSQAYVLPVVMAGTYRIKIHYWRMGGVDDRRWWQAYDELLLRLDRLEELLNNATLTRARRAVIQTRRDRLRERLDRWATPGAPQTSVQAEIVLFPGTSRERRWRFDRVVHRTGQLITLGQIEVTEEMIRASRRSSP